MVSLTLNRIASNRSDSCALSFETNIIQILDKSLEDKHIGIHSLTACSFVDLFSKISRFSGIYTPTQFYSKNISDNDNQILDKSLEDKHIGIHSLTACSFVDLFSKISRLNFLRKTSLNKEINFLRKVKSKAKSFERRLRI